MASSSAGYFSPSRHGGPSAAHDQADLDIPLIDDSDDDDPVANYSRDHALLSDDPLEGEDGDVTSFKRKQKQPANLAIPKFLSPFTTSRQASPSIAASSPRSGTPRVGASRGYGVNSDGNMDGAGHDIQINTGSSKDGSPLDWYVEGPGRRVGYEDMTAIDWIFEYTKERQRLRVLYSSATGILGYVQRMLDASQIWIVLILTGMAVGVVAAAIDVASDWLGDLKTGYCSAGPDGGRFYLNKYFCCWGYDEWSQCQDWIPWSVALHVTSTGGKWFIEYFFFICLSVSCLELDCLYIK